VPKEVVTTRCQIGAIGRMIKNIATEGTTAKVLGCV
jgi:hypothetical protein